MRANPLTDVALYVGGGGAVSLVEALVFPPREPRSHLLPPGPVIGMVWSALFAALGIARNRLLDRPAERRAVDALWLLCVTYPLYTRGMRSRAASYAGNAAVATATTLVATRVGQSRPDAARFIWPILPWAAWATIGLLSEYDKRR